MIINWDMFQQLLDQGLSHFHGYWLIHILEGWVYVLKAQDWIEIHKTSLRFFEDGSFVFTIRACLNEMICRR